MDKTTAFPRPGTGEIAMICERLGRAGTRGELGREIAALVLACSPRDVTQMGVNFSGKIGSINPEYRKKLDETVTGYLGGVYQDVRLSQQQGSFSSMTGPVPGDNSGYWKMVSGACSSGDDSDRLRFLKYLLAGFCMLVQGKPGHPPGMPFPGGDTVEVADGIAYCPVRTKANDVGGALCPFCPALQTPEIGYLRPPVNPSEHRKQEFIRNCYDHHNFNG